MPYFPTPLYGLHGRAMPAAADSTFWGETLNSFLPSDPRSIPGLQLYTDAYSLQGSLNYLDPVASWPDWSGLGRTVVQSVGASQPRFLPWSAAEGNYLHCPNVSGNSISIALADATYDLEIDYADGTSDTGTKAATGGTLTLGVGDAKIHGLRVARVTVLTGGNAVRRFNANLGNANSATVADELTGTWTINRTAIANAAQIVSAPAVMFDGTDDFLSVTDGLGMLRNVPGATMIATRVFRVNGVEQVAFQASNNIGQSRSYIGRLTSNNSFVGGRRLDGDTITTVTELGLINVNLVQAGVLDYSSAVGKIYNNGTVGATVDPFLTAGSTSDTDSSAITLGANSAAGSLFRGNISNILVWNRALTDAKIRSVSRFLARRARAGITVA